MRTPKGLPYVHATRLLINGLATVPMYSITSITAMRVRPWTLQSVYLIQWLVGVELGVDLKWHIICARFHGSLESV